MPQIDDIRRLDAEGRSVSEIARITGHDRKTVRKFLDEADFSPKPPVKATRPSKLDAYKPEIDRMLEEDRHVWRKQRHTAKRIYDLIAADGYEGRYTIVQQYVRVRRQELRSEATQAFLDLDWQPGTAQVDFGEADFDMPQGRVRMFFLVVSFPYSSMCWFQVFGGTTSECVCQGLEDIFDYIGGVPALMVFDNATGIGRRVCEEIHMAELFRRFRLHYGFEARFCNPHQGHEKGHVERKVPFVRSNVLVPVPQVGDLREYNESLMGVADGFAGKPHWRKPAKWGGLFADDRDALGPLPAKPFACVTWVVKPCDKWGEVTVGTHSYGVSSLAGRDAAVGLGALDVTILDAGTGEVARTCERRFGSAVTVDIDPVAELRTLSRRPGAWQQSRLRSQLPDDVASYLDGLGRHDLSGKLGMLSDACDVEGFDVAVESMRRLVASGRDFTSSDMRVLALRVVTGGDVPDAGPDLTVYNRAFLGREAV